MYSQFEKLRKKSSKIDLSSAENDPLDHERNANAKDSAHQSSRMLRILLSDGENKVEAAEIVKIPSLSENCPVGSKVLV